MQSDAPRGGFGSYVRKSAVAYAGMDVDTGSERLDRAMLVITMGDSQDSLPTSAVVL